MTMSTVHYIAMETSFSCLFINKEETAPNHRMQNWLKSHREALSASIFIIAHMNLCWYNIQVNVNVIVYGCNNLCDCYHVAYGSPATKKQINSDIYAYQINIIKQNLKRH